MLCFLWESISFQMLLVFFFVFLLVADYMKRRKPKHFPPSPFSLPFLGHLHLMNPSNPQAMAQKLTEKYGDIFSLQMGEATFVCISGLRMIKEVLINQAENFMDRPEFPINKDMFSNLGLISSNGHLWKQQRRFTLTTLRNFGLGKRSLEERIQEECRCLVDAFGEEQGNPFNPQYKISNAVANVICSVTLGNRFDYHDEEFQKLLQLLNETLLLHGTIMSQLYNSFPSIVKFLPGSHQTIFKNWKWVTSFVQKIIDKHKEDRNPSESRDFIDSYLQEMAKDDASGSLQEENLVVCTLDLLLAGTETTSTTIRWALLFMAKYPEIQARVQAEIDAVIGQGRQPALQDRNNMPYTNAVIHEVQRKGNIIPFNVPRLTTKDTFVDGFLIPKGTIMMVNFTSVMFDKNAWETPDTFNPGHFLKDGQFWKSEYFMPFSIGKRSCLGEVLARAELFLFFTSLLQKFTFQASSDAMLGLKVQHLQNHFFYKRTSHSVSHEKGDRPGICQGASRLALWHCKGMGGLGLPSFYDGWPCFTGAREQTTFQMLQCSGCGCV
ncbi:cytochrome P450 2J2-like isoform X1 [Strigops habroptila]|uniref:cytochrome P450 2J2-like isoform X1 n=1 Tax=Strigops habroptila TaxID=2489341 RepID=UPI0011CF36F0|nr:cytochrome P450 2J2-like isoform X1 [Strigops habroptila]XP_030350338.1 cytochrome P450 2J2-like isoform X1 [Strigops habroptila]